MLTAKKGDNGKVFLKLIKGNGEEKKEKKNKREEKACRDAWTPYTEDE